MAGGSEPATQWPWEVDTPSGNATEGPGIPPTPLPYGAAAASLPDDRAILVGGSQLSTGPVGTSGAEIYAANDNNWANVAPMTTARYGAVAATLPDGRVLVAGGESTSTPLASAEAFSMPTPANVSPPRIDDSGLFGGQPVRVGDSLGVYEGNWADAGADLLISDQWQRCLATCVDVGQPTDAFFSTYVVSAADAGATIRVIEVAEDPDTGASASVVSNSLGPVAPAGVHLAFWPSEFLLAPVGDDPHLRLPVARDGTTGSESLSYRVSDPSPGPYPAFTPITGVVTFAPGQSQAALSIPLQDHGVPVLPPTLELTLTSGSPLPVIAPSQMTIPVASDPSDYVRNPANPLALAAAPPAGNPLAGASFFADYLSIPGRQAIGMSASSPSEAAKLAVIARQPNVERFGAWNGLYPGQAVATYLQDAAKDEPGTIPMLSTYRVVDGHCGHWSDPVADQQAYHDWITSLAEGIGSHPAVLFLEMDSLITEGCLSRHGVTVRMHELHDAIDVLSNDPHLVVYLDAGAADALPARVAASLLRRAGVAQVQGFFLNSTHFDWTSREIRYGEQISRLIGGKHFVINTAENGQGPLRPRHPATQGNEVLCDPAGRGLGPLPTASTGYAKVDAFAWIANPGVSGGQCRPGAPPSGVFWPTLALELVRHADFRVR